MEHILDQLDVPPLTRIGEIGDVLRIAGRVSAEPPCHLHE
jgi:hypothetical protein